MDAEELIRQAADSVRSALGAAQRRAEEIVAEAESEAKRIRADAEAAASRIRGEAEGQAERRLEEVRGALDELRGKLSGEGGTPDAPAAPDDPPPAPAAPESPSGSDASDQAPTGGASPSTDELMMRLKAKSDQEPPRSFAEDPRPSPGNPGSGGEGAARLVAMKLALDGTPRAEARARLADDYEVDDLDALLDEVYAKAAG